NRTENTIFAKGYERRVCKVFISSTTRKSLSSDLRLFRLLTNPRRKMNMNIMTQFNHNQKNMSSLSASDCLLLVKNKLEAEQELSFAEQCVLMVASTVIAADVGITPTQDYFNKQQQGTPIDLHPMI